MIRNVTIFTLLTITLMAPALAVGNDWTVTDGQGEGLSVKKGLFGHKSTIIQDRYGNTFYNKKGILGTKDTQVSVLGNEFRRKKGIFGRSDIQGHTILGDTITTKKGLFGKRKTTVDLSGVTKTVHDYLGSTKMPAPNTIGNKSASNNPLEQDILKDTSP